MMNNLEIRQAFNALSDVVVNRSPPIRKFDQIYMKILDMLLQAELLSRWVGSKTVVFIGDGDTIGLTLVHLKALDIFARRRLPVPDPLTTRPSPRNNRHLTLKPGSPLHHKPSTPAAILTHMATPKHLGAWVQSGMEQRVSRGTTMAEVERP